MRRDPTPDCTPAVELATAAAGVPALEVAEAVRGGTLLGEFEAPFDAGEGEG